MSYESLFGTNRRFPQPIPLSVSHFLELLLTCFLFYLKQKWLFFNRTWSTFLLIFGSTRVCTINPMNFRILYIVSTERANTKTNIHICFVNGNLIVCCCFTKTNIISFVLFQLRFLGGYSTLNLNLCLYKGYHIPLKRHLKIPPKEIKISNIS